MDDRYSACYTVDESGGRLPVPYTVDTWSNLDSAIRVADQLTSAGQCGFVRRESDGATLAHDGTWILPEHA